ncbi:hypothetical protein DQX05_27170 [Paenibacillus thiaminolyticus]|uniref:Uncharacterized protein n=1 Tax=Paenibacillus thiaminolyticus TaxID=49283 RepID=A0A3A3GBM6_PANTH|nr:hypothetical protein DQX05_27170 [Paenibacillus thiaminolyticus]
MTLSLGKDSSYEAEKGEFILKRVRYRQKIMVLLAGVLLVPRFRQALPRFKHRPQQQAQHARASHNQL